VYSTLSCSAEAKLNLAGAGQMRFGKRLLTGTNEANRWQEGTYPNGGPDAPECENDHRRCRRSAVIDGGEITLPTVSRDSMRRRRLVIRRSARASTTNNTCAHPAVRRHFVFPQEIAHTTFFVVVPRR
jgi:hypothetical protein